MNGSIVEFIEGVGKKIKKDNKTMENISIYERSFINYLSFGFDSRVGFGKYVLILKVS